MEIWQALVLGIVQGLGEFLPISSSGHLLLVEKLLGNLQSEQMLFFNIMVHVGTLLAVLISLKDKWLPLLKKPLCKTNAYIAIACIPTVLMALLFKTFATSLIDGKYLGMGFVLTACLLYASDNFGKDKNIHLIQMPTITKSPTKTQPTPCKNSAFLTHNNSNTPQTKIKHKITKSTLYPIKTSVLIGVMQGVAILPGVSRSGATISALRLQGVEKEDATTFSFLLSIPIIIGSALYESLPLITQKTTLTISPIALIIGMISAFISGLISIKFFLKLIKNHSMTVFIIYTLLLGILVSVLPLFV